MSELEVCYQKTDDVVQRHVAGEDILVPVRGSIADLQRLYALDSVAKFAWDLFDGRHSLNEIAAEIAGAFDIDFDAALNDLRVFVQDLLDHDLLKNS